MLISYSMYKLVDIRHFYITWTISLPLPVKLLIHDKASSLIDHHKMVLFLKIHYSKSVLFNSDCYYFKFESYQVIRDGSQVLL